MTTAMFPDVVVGIFLVPHHYHQLTKPLIPIHISYIVKRVISLYV